MFKILLSFAVLKMQPSHVNVDLQPQLLQAEGMVSSLGKWFLRCCALEGLRKVISSFSTLSIMLRKSISLWIGRRAKFN